MEMSSWQHFQVDEAETTEETFGKLASNQYAVVLMEYGLPGRGGIKAAEIIHSHWPSVAIIGLVNSDEPAPAERILAAGASGCILRNIGLETLVGAIRAVMAGHCFFSNEIAQRLLEQKRNLKPGSLEFLTAKEKEVFLLKLEGLRDREIAARMGIAKRTVNKHTQHIHYKLGTRTALELLLAGLKFGLLRVSI